MSNGTTKTRAEQVIEMANAMLSDQTIGKRLKIKSRRVREVLSRARKEGVEVPTNPERLAHEHARGGVKLPPLTDAEITRLERAGRARSITGTEVLSRVVREVVSEEAFPALIDNILDDGVSS